jgi:CopG family transcriptional regulator / antitoxin EndoAI
MCNIRKMATAAARKSKVYTISLPPELAQRAEALARRDCRTMSELFREAFRTYSAQQARRTLEELGKYAAGRNPQGYTEADVPRLIQQVRTERSRRRKARKLRSHG